MPLIRFLIKFRTTTFVKVKAARSVTLFIAVSHSYF